MAEGGNKLQHTFSGKEVVGDSVEVGEETKEEVLERLRGLSYMKLKKVQNNPLIPVNLRRKVL